MAYSSLHGYKLNRKAIIVNRKEIVSILSNRLGDPKLLELKCAHDTNYAIMYLARDKPYIYDTEI